MPTKQPVLRPSYQSDAKYFRRLAHAVENDLAKPPAWRKATIAQIQALITTFEGADNVWQEETPSPEAQKP